MTEGIEAGEVSDAARSGCLSGQEQATLAEVASQPTRLVPANDMPVGRKVLPFR